MLTIILAGSIIACAFTLIPQIWKRNQFHPATTFLLLAIVDVYFPAIYWTLFGQVNNPDWLPLIPEQNILAGVLYHSTFLFLFIGCMLTVDGGRSPPKRHSPLSYSTRRKLVLSVSFLLILTMIKLGLEIIGYGSLEQWLLSRVIFSAVPDIDGSSVVRGGPLAALPVGELFQATVGLTFFYRKKFRHPWVFTSVFPSIAIGLAATTFLRGAVLNCTLMLIFSEIMRARLEPGIKSQFESTSARLRTFSMVLIAIVLSMYVYGTIRDGLRVEAASSDTDSPAEATVPTFLTAGHGLLGLSHIVAEYGTSVRYLLGKTYVDMLLLPVPRAIYSSKPEWYGIDDITRGMGWPESTQSAVTMPGEAFANFGLLGILIAIPLGAAFGMLQRLSIANLIRFILMGPTIFFQMATVANWMSFTGIMNAASSVVLLFTLSSYLKGNTTKKATSTPQKISLPFEMTAEYQASDKL